MTLPRDLPFAPDVPALSRLVAEQIVLENAMRAA